ncbi:MAG: choice-of-anchor J domain-containing protein [Paludibacteraceae bacterium]|nr:choice-of-anchor J domain-containing protein [Paludibacteraceae bacterium]
MAVTGKAADCSGTKRAPWVENFPDSTSSFYCWSIFDVNNDGVTLDFYYTDEAYTDLVAVYSFSEENAANDWLVSPALEITENNTLTFNYYVQEEYYPEKFSVYVIKDNPANYAQGTQVMATKTVSDTIATPVKIDLSAYNGQTIYIGIKVESAADSYNLYFDNFALTKTTGLKAANVTDMSVYPNPVVAGEDIYVSGVLDAVALNGMRLEVFNSLGQLVQTVKPTTSDITIRGIEQSGAYVVRIIDGNGKIMNSRFIVK